MTRLSSLAESIRRKLDVTPARAQAILDCAQFNIILDDVSAAGDPTIGTGRPCIGFSNIGAVVGELGHAQLFNPADSGVLIAVDQTMPGVGAGGGDDLSFVTLDVAQLTLGTAKTFADRREPGLPAGEMRSGSNAVRQGQIVADTRILADVSVLIPLPRALLLRPGEGVAWVKGVANQTVGCSWYWREITSSPQQLTL